MGYAPREMMNESGSRYPKARSFLKLAKITQKLGQWWQLIIFTLTFFMGYNNYTMLSRFKHSTVPCLVIGV